MEEMDKVLKKLSENEISIEVAKKEFLKIFAEASSKTADYEMSFEMINDLNKAQSIAKVIDIIFQIFTTLISPEKILYISMKKDQVEYIKTPESFIEMDPDLIEQMINFKGIYSTSEDWNGFILKIKHLNHLLAYIKIDGIPFPEYKDRYLNIALVLDGVFGLAISNALLFEALNKAIAELKRSNKDLEDFAHIISHDLKQPLTSIISSLSLTEYALKGNVALDPIDLVERSKDGAFRLNNMIDILLKYARVGTSSKKKSLIDCNMLLKSTIENLKARIEKNNALIKINELPVIYANEIEIGQLFQNLIDNSIKYRSDKTPEIEINAFKKDKEWLFTIKDNGIGIDPSHHNEVFNLFQRVGDTDSIEGTGVGLSICKKIIKNLGGNIWIDSELGKGTIFYFTIPISNGHSEENTKSSQKSSNYS